MAGVFHEVPTIGDLGGARAAPSPLLACSRRRGRGDNGDLWLLREPGLCGGGLPVWQEADRPPPFEIADDRPVALVAAPRPIIDADHARRRKGRTAAPANNPKQGVIADGEHQSSRKTRRRAATQGKAKVVDDIVKPAGPSRPRRQHAVTETLSKNAPTTQGCVAAEATRHNDKPNRAPCQRQISQTPKISGHARSALRIKDKGLPALRSRNHGHGAITYRGR